MRLALIVLSMACFSLGTGARLGAQNPVISEILANGSSGLLDEDGEASDWIELYHPGTSPVNLLGWALTDEPGNPLKWRFPAVILGAGDYLVVFASGKDRSLAAGELHANFKLTSQGEYLALMAPDGVTIASSFAPFPPQREGFSFGLGRKILEPRLVSPGSTARLLVPSNGALGATWTGGNEPFNDAAAGWLAVTVGVGYPGSGGPAPPVPLAYYSFDDTVLDASGGENHAQVRGAPTYSTDVPAKLGTGKSLSFDGIDDYISAELDVSESPYSLSLWFRADTTSRGIYTVVDGELGANGFDRLLFLTGSNISTRVWNNETIASTARNYVNNGWHHVAHVVGGWTNGQRIYVDGQLVASGAKAVSDFNWQTRIHIGFANDAASRFFDGRIDDVSIWNTALTETEISSLANGSHPMALAGFAPWIATDIGASLQGVNSSAYLRIPFDLAVPFDFSSLLLRTRFDDGFVAYLNGVEVARRNAPAALAYNSMATSNRTLAQAIRAEEIDLAAAPLRAGQNILAIQALNDSSVSAEFLFQPELLRMQGFENRFLSPPSPGGPNTEGVADFVADTVFSIKRGYFTEAFDVTLSTATPGAQIYYTTNGSAPGPLNPQAVLHTAPIRIARTTVLRAAAFRDGFQPTNVDSQTYIFAADVALQSANQPGLTTSWAGGVPADYGVDPDVVNTTRPGYSFTQALLAIPTLSLATDPAGLFGATNGIYYNPQGRGVAWERATSMELISPDGSRREFQADCGIRMHGNSSRDHGFTPKHPIRLLFKEEYGQKKLKEQIFEDSRVDSFDQLLLRGCSTDSWPVVDGGPVQGVQRWAAVHATYLRDQWMRDSQLAMGDPSCHGTYLHLFLNGLYWGLYNLAERPVDSFCANHLGGAKEEYDVIKDFAELQDGSIADWSAMLALAGAGLSTDAAYQRIQGNNPDGTRNPAYPVYLDVDNLINYMVLHIASGAEDWPHHNWWAGRRRGPESTGFKFFSWDQEISNDSLVRQYTLFVTRFEDPVSAPSPSYLYGQCLANPGFRRAFGDRVHRFLHNDGLLTPARNHARWMRRQTEIDQAIVGESARWGDSRRAVPYKREVEWLNEMNFERDQYFPGIREIALGRFERVGLYPATVAPSFRVNGVRQHGGRFQPGELISMEVPSAPRVIEVPLLTADAAASAHVPTSNLLGTEWKERAYVQGAHGEVWKQGLNGVGYENTSGYESVIRIDLKAEMLNLRTSFHVRLPFNIATQAAIDNLDGLRLKILYDDGFAAYLNGTRIADINAPAEGTMDWASAATLAGTEAVLGSPTVIDVAAARSLLRVGNNVLAIQGLNASAASSDLLILAELVGTQVDNDAAIGEIYYTTNDQDPTVVGAQRYAGPLAFDRTTLVKARTRDGADWSALTEAVFIHPDDLPLRITEIHYHPAPAPGGTGFDPDELEFVEVFNSGSSVVDLAGVRLSGGVEFDFSTSPVTRLGAQERLIVTENVVAFVTVYNPTGLLLAGDYTGRLSNVGEAITMVGPLGETLQTVQYEAAWYPETNGGGRSLVAADVFSTSGDWITSDTWKASAFQGGSPGQAEPDDANRGGQLAGDSNQDGRLDIADAVSFLFRLFGGGVTSLPCVGASISDGMNRTVFDANGDALVNLTDAVHVLTYLFRSGPAPVGGSRCVLLDGCTARCLP